MMLHSGVREIYVRRIRSSWVCSVLHQLCILMLYLALVDIDPLHPTKWLTSCLTNMLSLRTLAFVSFMSVVTFLQVIFFCKQMTFNSSHNSTRLKAVLHVFALDNVFSFLLHLIIGFAMGYMYITIKKNNPNNNYADDEFTFKVLCTTFIAVYIFVQNCLGEANYIQFRPLPGLPAKMQVKQDIKDCIKNSLWPGMKAFAYFNIVYYFCGAWMGKALCTLPGLGSSSVEFPSIFQMLQMWRLLSTYALCIIVYAVLTTMKAVTRTSLASRWKFAISGDEGQLVLCEALSLNSMPFIQQLAGQDLLMIAESDPSRRAELYTLSQPGGHPHNWKNIFKHFTNLVDQMCADLSPTTVEVPKPAPIVEEIHYPTSPGMRNMAFESPVAHKSFRPNVTPPSCTSVSSKARTWFGQQLDLLLKKPPIAFVFGERTDAKIAHALTSKGQTLAYLVSAFTSIAQASITEDSYGVVQQDLANIIVAIFKLKSAVDKLGSVCRKQNRPQSSFHFNIKSILRESTVQGIYKIIVTFKNHLDDVNVPQDLKIQLQSFKQFKET